MCAADWHPMCKSCLEHNLKEDAMAVEKPDSILNALPPIDRLLTRPDSEPLPTPLDPAGPQSHGYPADPKPAPIRGQGDPDETNPRPDDIARTA